MANEKNQTYTQASEVDGKGFAEYQRLQTGAMVKVRPAWFKATGEHGVLIPASKQKAIRLRVKEGVQK